MYCKKCGSQLEDESLFCPNCGQAQTENFKKPIFQPAIEVSQSGNDVPQMKHLKPRKMWIPIVAVVCTLIIGITVLSSGKSSTKNNTDTNKQLSGNISFDTYKTPLDLQMNILNARNEAEYFDAEAKARTVFEYEAVKGMLEMEYQREGRDYSDGDPERLGLQRGEDGEDLNVEYYGKDFEYYYKIAKQEKLDKDDLAEFQEEIREVVDDGLDMCEEAKYFDDSEWADLADHLECSRAEARRYVEWVEKIMNDLQSVEITDGYVITYSIGVKGSKLDEAEEVMEKVEMCVLKTNGKWIAERKLPIGG